MRRANKYRAVATTVDGYRFDSKAEAKRYGELKMLEKTGMIRDLEVQPVFPFVVDGRPVLSWSADGKHRRNLVAKMDFSYFEGELRHIIDVKGLDNPLSKLKRALVEHIYGVRVEVCR